MIKESLQNAHVTFTCLGTKCQSNCCGPFHGTRAVLSVLSIQDLGQTVGEHDLVSEDVSIFAQIRLTPEDVDRLRSAGLDHLMVYRGSVGQMDYYLRLRTDGSCAALKVDGSCSIHPHRPTICRAFPFYFDLFAGLCMVEACPGTNSEPVPIAERSEEIESAIKMYQHWLKEVGKSLLPKQAGT